jgi:hypothetical protein
MAEKLPNVNMGKAADQKALVILPGQRKSHQHHLWPRRQRMMSK